MSDTPTPPEASGDTPTPDATSSMPPTPRRKRPWTILGRLTEAAREQNWFAVLLELAIVVLGVVIGFQVTGWGQARADRAREQVYLRQLVEDLKETENNVESVLRGWFPKGASAGKLVRPYRSSNRPPGDSVLVWLRHVSFLNRPMYVTGTATALVETGDLNLIRNDSLRTAITRYLGRIDQQIEYDIANHERVRNHITTLSGLVDIWEAYIIMNPPGVIDSLARTDPMYGIPEAPARAFAPLDVEAFYQDRGAYTQLVNINERFYAMRGGGLAVLAETVSLREQIEAELTR